LEPNELKIVAIIPARMGSTRFPGKPLCPILGRPMIEHVYRRTAMCRALDGVYVATCDQVIMDAVDAFGGKALMTSSSHERASDRVAEAMASLDVDIVVMVQGDEPMVHPDMIDAALKPLLVKDKRNICVNLTVPIKTENDFTNPNTIKVVMDSENYAIYMSREAVPTRQLKPFGQIPAYKQVCIIPFTTAALKLFNQLTPTPLEEAESIDMLRFIEHGYKVKMVETPYATQAVDTEADRLLVEILMQDDPLTLQYLKENGRTTSK
jgi:3-deoxy-manno-octulosonate cytidylyltransferase (CMP-KDO synthetase)